METEHEIQEYLNHFVNPIISQMLVDIIKEKPKNVLQFCKEWFQNKIELHRINSVIDSDEDEEDLIDDQVFNQRKQRPRAQERRFGVCGESYSYTNLIDTFEPKIIKKKGLTKNRILFRLKSTFMFGDLSQSEYLILINAMQEITAECGDIVIKQGDMGEDVYILDEGELQILKIDSRSERMNYLKDIKQGQMFGELSMLYNIPRTSTIRAKKKCLLFKLDRKTFNYVLQKKNRAKNQVYTSALNKVDIFKELNREERDKIDDIVKEMTIHSNQYVIREGRVGNKFYIVQKGKLVALKRNQNGTENVVFQYQDGDYFGELSLLSNKTRAASVMTVVQVCQHRPPVDFFISNDKLLKGSLGRWKQFCSEIHSSMQNIQKPQKIDDFKIFTNMS